MKDARRLKACYYHLMNNAESEVVMSQYRQLAHHPNEAMLSLYLSRWADQDRLVRALNILRSAAQHLLDNLPTVPPRENTVEILRTIVNASLIALYEDAGVDK